MILDLRDASRLYSYRNKSYVMLKNFQFFFYLFQITMRVIGLVSGGKVTENICTKRNPKHFIKG